MIVDTCIESIHFCLPVCPNSHTHVFVIFDTVLTHTSCRRHSTVVKILRKSKVSTIVYFFTYRFLTK